MDAISYGRQVSRLAEQFGDEVALTLAHTDGTESTATWTELDRRSTQIAHDLVGRGVAQGDLVVVALPNSIEHVEAAFAAWKAGAVGAAHAPRPPAVGA